MPTKLKEISNPLLFQKSLLNWYDQNKRDLPWRRTKDPYAIFVSEMMLQQTQVKTVIPYYERFLKELPNWKTLAKCKEEKVLKLWEGLGYYRRARNLRAAAQRVVSDHGGKLPDSLDDILELPGVGPYSAGAILSIAYQKPHPLVDGNVIRVLSRIFLIKGNLKAGEGNKEVWDLAREILHQRRPGDFNQALMELGATVCLPEDPQCLLCPMMWQCQAAQRGMQNDLPEMPKATETVEVPMAAFLIEDKGKILVKKRSEDERWLKGMWEFPSAEGETFQDAFKKLQKDLKTAGDLKELQEVRHQITHHKVRLKLFKAARPKGLKHPKDFQWVSPKGLLKLPFASAQNKLRTWVLQKVVIARSGPRIAGRSRQARGSWP